MKWGGGVLEDQEDISVMDGRVLHIREISIVKALQCNSWALLGTRT